MPAEMKFFTPKAAAKLGTERGSAEWTRREQAYLTHLNEIWPQLTKGWRRLAEYYLHDSNIISVKQHEDSVLIKMRPGPMCEAAKQITLKFKGISESWLNQYAVGKSWIYSEVHLSKPGVPELICTLDDGKLRIAAADVELSVQR